MYMRGRTLYLRGAAHAPSLAARLWSISEQQTGVAPARSAASRTSSRLHKHGLPLVSWRLPLIVVNPRQSAWRAGRREAGIVAYAKTSMRAEKRGLPGKKRAMGLGYPENAAETARRDAFPARA